MSSAGERLLPELYSRVAHYRRQAFVERLGWGLQIQNGAELDQFDRPDTVYVIAQDDQSNIIGCARLLPTTGPYLLEAVFPQLLNGLPPPRSRDVWELSRFSAVDLNAQVHAAQYQFSSSTAVRLLEESIACAASRGARRLIAVCPVGVERLMHRAGFHVHRAGPPTVINGDPILACWIEVSGTA